MADSTTPEKHHCYMPRNAVQGRWANAYDEVIEDEEEHFFVTNGEYSAFANFCPICGVKAPKPIPVKA